jgi:hypothetical protein
MNLIQVSPILWRRDDHTMPDALVRESAVRTGERAEGIGIGNARLAPLDRGVEVEVGITRLKHDIDIVANNFMTILPFDGQVLA